MRQTCTVFRFGLVLLAVLGWVACAQLDESNAELNPNTLEQTIINGADCGPQVYPATVAVGIQTEIVCGGLTETIIPHTAIQCTGTLIAPDTVLTAAHCVHPIIMQSLGTSACTSKRKRFKEFRNLRYFISRQQDLESWILEAQDGLPEDAVVASHWVHHSYFNAIAMQNQIGPDRGHVCSGCVVSRGACIAGQCMDAVGRATGEACQHDCQPPGVDCVDRYCVDQNGDRTGEVCNSGCWAIGTCNENSGLCVMPDGDDSNSLSCLPMPPCGATAGECSDRQCHDLEGRPTGQSCRLSLECSLPYGTCVDGTICVDDQGKQLPSINDVALLFLDQVVTQTLPAVVIAPDEVAQIQSGKSLAVAGWGMQVSLTPKEQRDPNNLVGKVGHKQCGDTLLGEVSRFEIQVGLDGQSVRKCKGDSGGPAYLKVATQHTRSWRVIGITSRIYGFENTLDLLTKPGCDLGGIDTRVDAHYAWLDKTLREACQNNIRAWCDVEGIIPPEYYDDITEQDGSDQQDGGMIENDADHDQDGSNDVDAGEIGSEEPPASGGGCSSSDWSISGLLWLTILALFWLRRRSTNSTPARDRG